MPLSDISFRIGILGGITLVIGAARKGTSTKPYLSTKNRCFLGGSLLMLTYAILNTIINASPENILFIIFQTILIYASILMMITPPLKFRIISISLLGLLCVGLSLFFAMDPLTIIFILGLIGTALGYAMTNENRYRYLALSLGSFFIALFSYYTQNWIFCGINLFFCLFSAYYLFKNLKQKKSIN